MRFRREIGWRWAVPVAALLAGLLFATSANTSHGVDIRPIGFLIGINLLLTFTLSGISWQGHVGGLVTGAALAAAWAYPPRKYRLAAQLSSSVVLAVIIAVAVLARTHALTG